MKFAAHYDNPEIVLWLRVVMFAVDHDGQALSTGQLRRAVDPYGLLRSDVIPRAIARAKRSGLLAAESTVDRLVCRQDEESAA